MTTKTSEKKPKKSAEKASAVKKPRSTQKITERTVRVLKPEEYFWLVGGGGLESLEALAVALEQMSEAQFAYHTERDGNDFARWIQGVFGETTLSRSIAKQKTKNECAAALRAYLSK